ncbi:LysR family transcriptional regulator [Rhodanobacter glycinis]|uniref:DNA-binding transcriptional regulator, LysR family n=1 Tax=Rhodanobacter glycinis TaxID=582702 RepID=A0A1I4EVW3_9GAMM|nr:LysR family transcriptional regulator [Rhodanobacter glycinis]SFL09814.1 DNA-binding transcriptional regulator, LysR family [Rhodanobacter glycinis]
MLDNVTINQLRAFVAVCDQGSFSGAARKLSRAQSAISHAIKALESAFDVELFERNTRKAQLTATGRSLLPDARAVISRTEEMKTRAGSIARAGAPQLSVAVDVYFPRAQLIDGLRTLQVEFPTAAINLRITTMQGGERLVFERECALAVTIENVPAVNPDAIERHWLCEAEMATVCAPSHPLASTPKPIPSDEFGRHVQIVVTDNQPHAEKTQQGVAGKRQWLVNDLGAKRDLLKAGLGWGHMPRHLVGEDLASGELIELERRAWHLGPLTFMVSQRRGHDLSPCESRLVELLGKPQGIPKEAGRRPIPGTGAKV